MQRVVQLALLADGVSDKALQRPLDWAVRQIDAGVMLADWQFIPRRPPGGPLHAAVQAVRNDYKPDLLFVHRDAEAMPHASRKSEIPTGPGLVAVVPVRMTEAWLLIDERAIRRASGNPNGSVPLDIPRASKLDALSDPKKRLVELLVTASEHRGRRLDRFKRADAVQLVANYIEDFSSLRALDAFVELERDLRAAWSGLAAKVTG